MAKKNRVQVFGKTFHLTPAGRILPLGAKQNKFTKCVSEELVWDGHSMLRAADRPDGFEKGVDDVHNRNLFKSAVYDCQNKLWPTKYPLTAEKRIAAQLKAKAKPKAPLVK